MSYLIKTKGQRTQTQDISTQHPHSSTSAAEPGLTQIYNYSSFNKLFLIYQSQEVRQNSSTRTAEAYKFIVYNNVVCVFVRVRRLRPIIPSIHTVHPCPLGSTVLQEQQFFIWDILNFESNEFNYIIPTVYICIDAVDIL